MLALKFGSFLASLLVPAILWAADAPLPELVTPQRHSDSVDSLQVSQNNEWFVSAGRDRFIRVWSLPELNHLRSIPIPGGDIYALALHPSKPWVAVGQDQGIQIWDIQYGQKLSESKSLFSDSIALAWTPDGTKLASIGARLRVFDLSLRELWAAAGPKLDSSGVAFMLTNHGQGQKLVFSADGRRLFAAGYYEHNVAVWDVSNGALIGNLTGPTKPVMALALSPDGKTLYAGSIDGHVFIYNSETLLATGAPLAGLQPIIAIAATGNKLFAIWKDPVRPVNNTGIRVWNLSQAEATDVPLEDGTLSLISLGLSPKNGVLIAGSTSGQIKSWNLSTFSPLSTLESKTVRIEPGFTPQGRLMLNLGFAFNFIDVDQQIKVSSLYAGGGCHFFLGGSRMFCNSGITGSPDDAFRNVKAGLGIFDPTSLSKVEEIAGNDEPPTKQTEDPITESISDTVIDSQGHYAAWTFAAKDFQLGYHHVVLWNLKERTRIVGLNFLNPKSVTALALSQDASLLAVGLSNDEISLIDTKTGDTAGTLKAHAKTAFGFPALVFSPDRRFLFAGDAQGAIFFWDLKSMQATQFKGHEGRITALAFSPDGKSLYSSGDDRKLLLWSINENGVLSKPQELATLQNPATRLTFHPAKPFLVAADNVGSLALLNTESRKIAAQMDVDCSFAPCRWIVTTPEGLFESSDDSWREMAWRFNNDTFSTVPISTYFVDYFRPNLLARLLHGEQLTPPAQLSKLDRSQASAELSVKRLTDQPYASVSITVMPTSPKSEVRDAKLFRNGVLAAKWAGALPPGKDGKVHLQITTPLAPGPNEFRALAYNHANVASKEALAEVELPVTAFHGGALHILAIGIDQYADPRLTLKYAAADSQLLIDSIRKSESESWQYRSIDVVRISDADATRDHILAALSGLAARTSVQDNVIIFFSGHGYAKKERFYVVAHDFDGGQRGLVSDQDLERVLLPLQMNNALLILDTCDSGQVVDAKPAAPVIGPINTSGLAQLAYEKHIAVITASQAFQAAREIDSYGHGLLTQALVQEGLVEFKADRKPKDGNLTWFEWLDFARDRVPQLEAEWKQGQRGIVRRTRTDSLVQTPSVLFRESGNTSVWIHADPLPDPHPKLPSALSKYVGGGQPTVFIFWDPPTLGELLLSAQAIRAENPFFRVVGVDNGGGLLEAMGQSVTQTRLELGINVPEVRDPDLEKTLRAFNACSPDCFEPYTIVLDAQGNVTARIRGYRSRETLREIFKSTLKNNGGIKQ